MRGSLAGFYTILNEHPGVYAVRVAKNCRRLSSERVLVKKMNETSNVRLPLELGSDRRETSATRVSED